MERIARIAKVVGAGLGVLLACLLAFGYTVGGGYFPGGPMVFPGDDVPVQGLVVAGLWAIVGVVLALGWLWEKLVIDRVPERFRELAVNVEAIVIVVLYAAAILAGPAIFVGVLAYMVVTGQ